jgi:hypothetical protein
MGSVKPFLDLATGNIVRTFPAGYNPDAAVSPDGSRLYVISKIGAQYSSTLVVYETRSGARISADLLHNFVTVGIRHHPANALACLRYRLLNRRGVSVSGCSQCGHRILCLSAVNSGKKNSRRSDSMPFTKPRPTPELSGLGKVFKGDLFLSDVRYAIAMHRNSQDVSGPTTANVIPTQGKYTLSISTESPAIQVAPHYLLTLKMEDGKRLDFYWYNGEAHVTNGIY